jgi:hypothetical protein
MTLTATFIQLPQDTAITDAWPVAVLDETATSLARRARIRWKPATGELGPVLRAVGKADGQEPAFGLEAHEGHRGVYVFGQETQSEEAVRCFVRSLGLDPAAARHPDGSSLGSGLSSSPMRTLVPSMRERILRRMAKLQPYVEEAQLLGEALDAIRGAESSSQATLRQQVRKRRRPASAHIGASAGNGYPSERERIAA